MKTSESTEWAPRGARVALVLALAGGAWALPKRADAGPSYRWVPSSGGRGVANQVTGGREKGRALVVCRARHQGGLHPGKVVGGNCNFGYGGQEIRASQYEVLVWLDGQPSWSSTGNRLAPRALAATTYDGRQGYVCRTDYNGGTHPGKVVSGRCNIGYGGKEVIRPSFQTLLAPPPPPPPPPPPAQGLVWARPGTAGAVVGGREASRPLIVCRAPHQGGQHPGKVVAGRCNFGYGGREIQGPNYQVLVARGAPVRWSGPRQGPDPGAFAASTYDGRQGYVCRADYAGGKHPGKVVSGLCNIGYGGKEVRVPVFETLLDPSAPAPQMMQVAPTPAPPPVTRAPSCVESVQGQIAYDSSGRRNWPGQEVRRLCAGGSGSEPARCYQTLMSGNVSWGRGTTWQTSNAMELCAGSTNGARTIACFRQRLGGGSAWKQAIDRCKGR